MVLIYIILITMLLNICVCIFLFQIIIMRYLKNEYKLKNVLPCKLFRLNLNKTLPKMSNINFLNKTFSKKSNTSLLNKMVFLLRVSIIIGYSSQFVSGTIIRGTLKTPNSQLVTPISIKLQRPDGYD
jgi:hypothetical protein